ncbi:MAG: lipopolysaccharide heptosyltransferase II [Pyrinomonadaceae bacterium]
MKIIVRGANWIGDAVMTIPALRELRRLFPDAEIVLHTRPWAEGIFRDAEFIDEILMIKSKATGFRETAAEAKRLKAMRFDLAVLFTNSFQTAAVVRLAGIKKRFGYAREGRGILLSDPIKPPKWKDERHQVYYYLNIVGEIERRFFAGESISQTTPEVALSVSETRRIDAREFLESNGVDPKKNLIAIGAGSTNSEAKRWGEAKFAEIGRRLFDECDAQIVMLGSESETDISDQVAALGERDFIDLTGATDISMAAAILAEADLFISNDMGLAHLAAAVGTQTIVIFGPTNETVTRPFGDKNVLIVREPVECSPCMLRKCPIDHRCMTRISTERVFDLAASMLKGQ